MEYLGQIVVFISALVAIKGGTWKGNAKGFRKITLTGYITIFFVISGLIISISTTKKSLIESKRTKNVFIKTESNTETTKQELQATEIELAKANSQIDTQNQKLSTANSLLQAYKEIIDQIKNQSDRQDQTVMMDFVDLKPGQIWRSPSRVYSGSIVEFYGFEDGLFLEYDNRDEKITAWDGHAIQTAVIGESGRSFVIFLSNRGKKEIMGKVHVVSSPRTRTAEWSWIDEAINKVSGKR